MGAELPGYRVIKQLGVGAASKINLAVELKTGRKVAIKSVVRNSSEDDPFIQQVETEYAVCSKLDHPALRKTYSIHRIRKLLKVSEIILVMEMVDGLSLETARPNRLNTFLKVFQRVAEGLHAMHAGGYVHSDIKPTNILIAQGGIIKIIDFGQSCPMNFRKERIQGTPDYIAPEQVNRAPLDARTDVFNLGATMYWLLTSENYPTAISGAEMRGKITLTNKDRPLAPVELNDKIPLALSNLVMECCRESPADRPADMKQLLSRLAVVQKLWAKQRESWKAERPGANVGVGAVIENSPDPDSGVPTDLDIPDSEDNDANGTGGDEGSA